MRMHRKLASIVKDAPLIMEGGMDPNSAPSKCSLIMRGKEPYPKASTKVGDAAFDKLYVNYEREPSMVRIVTKGKDKSEIMFYAASLREWLKCDVSNNYPLHTDLTELPSHKRAPSPEAVRQKNLAKAKGLLKGKEAKPAPATEPENGKLVFKGKLGSRTVLMDVGNGAVICDVPDDLTMQDAAKKAKRELVKQDKASSYAMFVFTNAWKESRKTVAA